MPDGQRVLGGRYLLKDKVGNGGMASVYRAQDQVLDRTVAVKIMLPQYAGDATFAARFKQEAQAAAGLQSPYIVGVYDWGKDGDTYYIVMEYLRGTDLKSGVRPRRPRSQEGRPDRLSICGALSVAHKHEIIHRDIKPQNIMVLPDGNIKVMTSASRAPRTAISRRTTTSWAPPTTSPQSRPAVRSWAPRAIFIPSAWSCTSAPPAECPSMATMPSPWLSSRSTNCPSRRAR